ncbi:ABC transporter permease [Georgfuchsia toluolica]|uniref:ABC transporter permease n=1 Tax=Georgfuchsia toluolica TaxID=424218 RepID=A0A916J3E4_9PROT|nr:ABC transporter permease [Georgfuchsia toluolica]CAG4883100.1 ABC transporter permease [Georgfuchsia toluolica]
MAFLLRRCLHAAFVLMAVSLLVFCAIHLIGNPVELLIDPQASADDIARTTHALGLDQPLWRQYLLFVERAASGDLGRSFVQGAPVLDLIAERLPATLELASVALLIAVGLGVPLGLRLAVHPGGIFSRGVALLSMLGFSLPTFWVGLLLILLFAVQLGWLPPGGRVAGQTLLGIPVSFLSIEGWKHLLLPAINLALFNTALMIRVVRAGAADALGRDYVRFARARGLAQSRIVGVHVLKNIAIPLVTLMGLEFGSLIAFAVVTETVFGWPGMGKLLIDSINALDRPVVVAYLLVTTTLFVAINLGVDIIYTLLDPRIKLNEDSGHA